MNPTDPDPFKESVETMRRELAGHTAPPVTTATSIPHSPSPIIVASPMVNPVPYSGTVQDCNGFLLQCSLALEMQPEWFHTYEILEHYVISLLTGRALQWAETMWYQSGPVMQ